MGEGKTRKIGVLTFHRCVNYGSYWQARSLLEGLAARGDRVELLDHDSPVVRRAEYKCALQPALPLRTPRMLFGQYSAKARRFEAAADRLPRSPKFALDRPEEAGAYDLIVVGSDEVWNFQHPWYGGKRIFFGDGLQASRLVAYAASFGNHDAEVGIDPSWSERLRRFSAISVRDENGRRLIGAGLGQEPELVLDPCLQFLPVIPKDSDEAPYLALYGHGFPEWFLVEVRRVAARRGWRIVSIGYHEAAADEQRIGIGPEQFPDVIGGAEAVATNFFHGSVFAIAADKPFVCVASAYRRNKLRDLTQALGAEDHLVDARTPPGRFEALLATPLAPRVAERIAAMRARSNAYLEQALA